jgi:c-di-AMP phosphodiesterase-like protein
MINASKIYELITNASNVVIMSHKTLDLDALGSSLGMFYVCSHLNRDTYILIDDTEFEEGVERALLELKKLDYKVNIKNFETLESILDKDTLLIIIDTNKKEILQNTRILDSVNRKILLDHHIKDPDSMNDFDYEYVNVDESSATEIAIKVINGLNVYIPDYIATIMLAGIFIDTDEFNLKATDKTFEAASLLKKFGANSIELQYLLKQDFDEYTERQKIIMHTEIINREMAIALGDINTIYERSELAKASDTILQFNNIEASFVIGKTEENEISISARSLGKINVQTIMEQLNGGGHETDAATQMHDITLIEAKKRLMNLISKK